MIAKVNEKAPGFVRKFNIIEEVESENTVTIRIGVENTLALKAASRA